MSVKIHDIRQREKNKERLKKEALQIANSQSERFNPINWGAFYKELREEAPEKFAEFNAKYYSQERNVERFAPVNPGLVVNNPGWDGIYPAASDLILPIIVGQDSIIDAPFMEIKTGIRDEENWGIMTAGECIIQAYTCAFGEGQDDTVNILKGVVKNYSVFKRICAETIFDTYLNNSDWQTALTDPDLPFQLTDIIVSVMLKQLKLELQRLVVYGNIGEESYSIICANLEGIQFNGILKQIYDSSLSTKETYGSPFTVDNIFDALLDLSSAASTNEKALEVPYSDWSIVMSTTNLNLYKQARAKQNFVNSRSGDGSLTPPLSDFIDIPIHAYPSSVWSNNFIMALPNYHPTNGGKTIWFLTDFANGFENVMVGKNEPMSKRIDIRTDVRAGVLVPFPELITIMRAV